MISAVNNSKLRRSRKPGKQGSCWVHPIPLITNKDKFLYQKNHYIDTFLASNKKSIIDTVDGDKLGIELGIGG